MLKSDGVLVSPDTVANIGKIQAKTVNVALLGVLSTHLDIPAPLGKKRFGPIWPRSITK